MSDRVEVGALKVATVLYDFINTEAAPGTGIEAATFWAGLENIVKDLGPKNRALLEKRDSLQAQIDDWHRSRKGQPDDPAAYKQFLGDIGYLVPEGGDLTVSTANVDPEIAYVNGEFIPLDQAVVPIEDRGFLFADGVYEVVATYRGKLFALEPHLQRLERSLRELRISL
nr:hypothetical protein [Alphaproteobacteria bacterium]